MELRLVEPTIYHKNTVAEFKKEFVNYQSSTHGLDCLEEYDNYNQWLKFSNSQKNEETCIDNRVPGETLFVFDKQDTMVGIVNIRYRLNEYLSLVGGHIGISIRPTYRHKGLGTKTIKLALQRCQELNIDKVLITCNKDNHASAKMIINNRGVLDGETVVENGEVIQRYWIENK